MAGRLEDLNEYQIAVEVLGRRKDFSLTDDSSVRNRAYELRQRLEKYYTQEQPRAAIRIEIPRGGYIPYFTRQQMPAESEPWSRPTFRRRPGGDSVGGPPLRLPPAP